MSDIEIRRGADLPEAGLSELYAAAGWDAYLAPGLLGEAYSRSLYALGAFDGGRLIGALRAVGDGCTVVLIQDLLVLPEYRRRGTGRRLLDAALDDFAHVRQRLLLADDTPELAEFYWRAGFVPVGGLGCKAYWCINRRPPQPR